MGKNKDDMPYYLKNGPFFFLTVLLAPVAVLLVLLYWEKLSTQMRNNHLTFSILMTMLYISKILPDGLFKIIFAVFTWMLILFVTYIYFGGVRKGGKS